MNIMQEWSRHQVVQALKVGQVEQMQEKIRIFFQDEEFGPVFISKADAARMKPKPGGYLVIDDFSRIEYMGATEFESKFKRMPT